MDVEIYENLEDGTQCWVRMPEGGYANLSLQIAENLADTVYLMANRQSYLTQEPRMGLVGNLLFVIINEEGHVALSDGEMA